MGFIQTPFDSHVHFDRKFWINLINLGYFSVCFSSTSPFFYLSLRVKLLGDLFVCLCCGFTAKSTQWGHVERGQFT